MEKITYRNAKKNDSPMIVKLMLIAAGGAFEFLLHDLISNVTPEQIMLQKIYQKDNLFSYQNCFVAEMDGEVVGLLHACSTKEAAEEEGGYDNIPKDRLKYVQPFFDLKINNSYYLFHIAVLQECRGMGVGHCLLEAFKQHAKKRGFKKVSLQVWADNVNGISLYEKHKFKIVAKGDIKRHPLLPHDGGILLMEGEV